MSILSDTSILAAIASRDIVIEPFDEKNLGGNSYDVHLSPYLATYVRRCDLAYAGSGIRVARPLDCAKDNDVEEHFIGVDGIVLDPDVLYLGSTVEYTETHRHVPYLDGRSSAGRLGISIHRTAGRGDVGFCNHWTLEITVDHAIRVYAGMRIAQLTFHTVEGEVHQRYRDKPSSTYGRAARNPKPVPSGMWRQFQETR